MSQDKNDPATTPDELHQQLGYLNLPFMQEHVEELAQQAAAEPVVPRGLPAPPGRRRSRPAPGPGPPTTHPAGPLPRAQDPRSVRLHLAHQDQPPGRPEPLPPQVHRGQGQRHPRSAEWVWEKSLWPSPWATPPAGPASASASPPPSTSSTPSPPPRTPAAWSRNSRSTPARTSWSCDELGYLPIDKHGADLLFQIISQRYERGSIVLTTNKVFKHWPCIFNNDSTLTSAILDRILHHAETLVIEGKSYRMKDRIEP